MCDIVEIRGFESKRRVAADLPPAEGAQILFFLGVRYERHDAPAAPKAPRKRSPRLPAGKRKPTVKRA